jgi:hypothetical protein
MRLLCPSQPGSLSNLSVLITITVSWLKHRSAANMNDGSKAHTASRFVVCLISFPFTTNCAKNSASRILSPESADAYNSAQNLEVRRTRFHRHTEAFLGRIRLVRPGV